jgi:hypothetical protein
MTDKQALNKARRTWGKMADARGWSDTQEFALFDTNGVIGRGASWEAAFADAALRGERVRSN